MKRKNLINQRFGKLMVLSHNSIISGKTYWNCICDCGNIKITYTHLLTSGRCKSCGCLLTISRYKEKNRELAAIKNQYRHSIIKRSKELNLEYDIDLDYFEKLIKKPYYYCGLENSTIATDRTNNATIIKVNGLDRINSNLGYMKSNTVTCCKYCNNAKNTLSQLEFKNLIVRIYNNYCIK